MTAVGRIDVHAHVVLEATLGRAGTEGPFIESTDDGDPVYRVGRHRLVGVDYRGTPFMDPALRVARMDEVGIAHQVLSPNPLTWFHHLAEADAVAFCTAHNDALVALVAARADRLSGLAQLPAQWPDLAAAELRRGVALGLRGGAMGTEIGRSLDDPTLGPLWEAAVELDVPLFLHPAPPGMSGTAIEPAALAHDFGLHGWFTHQETLAVVSLVFGRVLDRHPGLDLCVSHGGGALALLLPRLRHAMATRPGGSGDPDDVDRSVRRLWFDDHVGDVAARDLLAERVGTDRLLLGTNFAGWDDDAGDGLAGRADPDGSNARRLLRLA